MVVLLTAKNEEDLIKNEGAVNNTKYQIFKHSRAANAAVYLVEIGSLLRYYSCLYYVYVYKCIELSVYICVLRIF